MLEYIGKQSKVIINCENIFNNVDICGGFFPELI